MTATAETLLLDRLCDVAARTVFVPVRHHSPACARFAARLIRALRPECVLIEGPHDFEPFLDELALDHRLPIAIYSFVRTPEGERRGAYYPFCEHSPEWQAFRAARGIGATVRFVDLPWADTCDLDRRTHRYADAELRRGRFVRHLCERFAVDDFDALWDRLVEADPSVDDAAFLRRVHGFCLHVRSWDDEVSEADRRREAFMAGRLREALASCAGRVLVVTGGYHSGALCARVEGFACPGIDDETDHPLRAAVPGEERGIALTPYSYERLDGLSGYDAGMPSPGFYDRVWHTPEGETFSHRPLLRDVVEALRRRKQTASTADLVAVETTARTLAALRGRNVVWRTDLLDAVTASLVKEEVEADGGSPFVEAVLEALRGSRRGRVAEGTRRPPLVADVEAVLAERDLVPQATSRDVDLELLVAEDRERSRVLHRLRILEIPGFVREAGTDFAARTDLVRPWERWRIAWSPEFQGGCIEAARYGTSLREASTARLSERAATGDPGAAEAARILLDCALAGLDVLDEDLVGELRRRIVTEGRFAEVAAALSHLLYLFCHDESLGTAGAARLGGLVEETFSRALWLLESVGGSGPDEGAVVEGLGTILETFRHSGGLLHGARDELVAVLRRIEGDRSRAPALRGGAVGAAWSLGEADADRVLSAMLSFSDPAQLGDFLAGTFRLAREVAQRDPRLVRSLDELLTGCSGDEFLAALPALRMAFTYFTPREKHLLLATLFESLGLREAAPLETLQVDSATAALATAHEARILESLRRHGIRGGDA